MPTAEFLERNRWGHGLIRQPDGSTEAYLRVSAVASIFTDKTALTSWKLRNAAVGLADNPHLLAAVQHAVGQPYQLDGIVEQAMAHAGANEASQAGTHIHDLTEQIDAGLTPPIPPEYQPVIASYIAAVTEAGIVPVDAEQFIVNDELKVCGSYDRTWLSRSGDVVIGDLKTGKDAHRRPHQIAMQIAMYANGVLYDPATGERTPLDPAISREVGLLIHAPLKGSGCKLYELDLVEAYEWARRAAEARSWTKDKTLIREWSK